MTEGLTEQVGSLVTIWGGGGGVIWPGVALNYLVLLP